MFFRFDNLMHRVQVRPVNAIEYATITLSLLALVLSAIACVLVFAWRKTTPEVSDLRRKFLSLSMAQTDIVDKLQHWMARDDARHARKGKKNKRDDFEEEEEVVVVPPRPLTAAEHKAELRQRLFRRQAS